MSIVLEDFKASFEDLCRPNRFYLSIDDDDKWLPEFEYMVKSCSIPARTVGEVNLNWQGMVYHVPTDPSFDTFTATFLNDTDFKLKAYFEQWMERIAEVSTNFRGVHDTLKQTLVVSQLDGAGNIIRIYKLKYANPTNIGEIELDYDSNDAVQTFQVTFSYSYFIIEEVEIETEPTADIKPTFQPKLNQTKDGILS